MGALQNAFHSLLPHSVVVVDKFHVVKLVLEDFSKTILKKVKEFDTKYKLVHP